MSEGHPTTQAHSLPCPHPHLQLQLDLQQRGHEASLLVCVDQQVVQRAVDAVEQAIHYDVIEVVQVALPVRGALLCLEVLQILHMERERESIMCVCTLSHTYMHVHVSVLPISSGDAVACVCVSGGVGCYLLDEGMDLLSIFLDLIVATLNLCSTILWKRKVLHVCTCTSPSSSPLPLLLLLLPPFLTSRLSRLCSFFSSLLLNRGVWHHPLMMVVMVSTLLLASLTLRSRSHTMSRVASMYSHTPMEGWRGEEEEEEEQHHSCVHVHVTYCMKSVEVLTHLIMLPLPVFHLSLPSPPSPLPLHSLHPHSLPLTNSLFQLPLPPTFTHLLPLPTCCPPLPNPTCMCMCMY